MKLTHRLYQDENDYWRIRPFLREVLVLNGLHEKSWPAMRWDYWRWHVQENIFRFNLPDVVWLWECDGRLHHIQHKLLLRTQRLRLLPCGRFLGSGGSRFLRFSLRRTGQG